MIPYAEAMLKYGVDKPDLRNPIEIVDVTDVFARDDVTFNAFKNVVKSGGVVRAIPAPGAARQPRSFFDKLNDWARAEGAPGLGYIIFEGEGRCSAVVQGDAIAPSSCPRDRRGAIANRSAKALAPQGRRRGVLRLRQAEKAARLAGAARVRIGNDLGVCKKDVFEFCWIVDFPMYEWNEDEKKIDFSHNPFSMPQGGLEALDAKDPLEIKAFQYDIVCNGIELSSGAIRNHRPDIMRKAFEIAGYGEEVLEERFGGMYRAFQCGAPPHGGIAPGVDRIVMLLAGEENLREVVLFPMNQRAEDLMMGAPSPASPKQLRELHIRLNLPEK